jgi:phosphodiesterase/alkaline phosphatase D-like protein
MSGKSTLNRRIELLMPSPPVQLCEPSAAFISWTTRNPGGTILHYAVVRYGKDPNHLQFTAKSPTRINPSRSEMMFRVRIQDLEPGTTYYYHVSSEQASGISDPETSGVNQFMTRRADWISAKK